MKDLFFSLVLLTFILCPFANGNAEQTSNNISSEAITNSMLENKKSALENLIESASLKNINTLKEKTALRTAEIFMGYADWDEDNIETNEKGFAKVARYKEDSVKWAALLPNFERSEISKMLDSAKYNLQQVIDGKIKRLPITKVDWSESVVKDDEILFNNKPIFLNDWTWKPTTDKYTEYHGNMDGFFLNPTYVFNENGDIKSYITDELKVKPTGNLGFIFINNNAVPSWLVKKYPKIKDGPGLKYTAYDINNPGAKVLMSDLIAGTVPFMAGKKYSELGYMLCNEPHWNCIKDTWTSSPFSYLAYEDFKVWLKEKHKNIESLNSVWNTNYSSFEAIDGPKIMTENLHGTPMFTDFMLFNQYRVTEWYTFMKSEIRKYDPAAKVHIKLIPHFWTEDGRDSGIDLEALTSLSDIIGNDASTCGPWMWGPAKFWEDDFSFDFVDPTMGYDFMKSVSPNKIIFNTENHFLSTGKYRDLYQSKEYVRCNYWLGTIHGLTASQTWYWARREDGSSRDTSNGYMASNNHQPRVVNEVHQTMIDLNSVGDKIMKFQRQRKGIRLFYSKASAINKSTYMSSIFEAYKASYFNGLAIGFATKDILNNQSSSLWDVVVVTSTPNVFSSDFSAIQSYLNNGGTVIVDDMSLKFNEYNKPLDSILVAGKGNLIKVSSLSNAVDKAFDYMTSLNSLPNVTVKESISAGSYGNSVNASNSFQKTCSWRVIDGNNGNHFVNIINLGKTARTISLTLKDGSSPKSISDVLTGVTYNSNTFEIPIYGVKLLEVKDISNSVESIINNNINQDFQIYPIQFTSGFKITLPQKLSQNEVKMQICSTSGVLIKTLEVSNNQFIELNTIPSGIYFVKVENQIIKVIKK